MGPIGIRFTSFAVVAASVIALAACGGGGGGGGGSASTSSSAATITSANAVKLAGAVMSTGSEGSSSTGMAAAGVSTSTGTHPGIAGIVKQLLDTSTTAANQHTGTTATAAGAGISNATSTYYGCTSGTMTQAVSYTAPDATGLVTATLDDTYSKYSCNGITINGSLTVSGTYQPYTDASSNPQIAPMDVSISIANLSTASGSDTITLNGTFGYGFVYSDTTNYTTYKSFTFSMTANASDSQSGITETANNFSVSYDGSGEMLSLSGTVGDSIDGYVTLSSSPNPLTYGTCSTTTTGIFDSGDTITLTGGNGSSATINFINDGSCTTVGYGYYVSYNGPSGSGTTAVQSYTP